ncbi:hypothetical protein FKP32DRAFT_1651318 [Trametes sanguinea]|nr:hypothetical protein FKP32DRAFT_1651318 [Trametes sanguinea]
MLRASYLGLTFTHGISRCYILPHLRSVHQQPCYETRPMRPALSRIRSEEATTVSDDSGPVGASLSAPSSSPIRGPAVEEPTVSPAVPTQSMSNTSMSQAASAAAPLQDSAPSCPPEATEGPCKLVPPLSSRHAYHDHQKRTPLYQKLVEATDLDEAWETYQELLKYRPPHLKQSIPQKYLHHFAALLVRRAQTLPPKKFRTQNIFLRLLSVLNTIYYSGGQLRLWEWNALIECAGRGWRKTRVEDFQSALNVYHDMVANRPPGSSFASSAFLPLQDESQIASKPVTPDVVTYTTLITIAGRTLKPSLLHLAEEMLIASGIRPNRITYLVFLRYYAEKGNLSGVRSIVHRLQGLGWELGLDGLNALLWAYGRSGELEIAGSIYRILRRNLLPDSISAGDVQEASRKLAQLESITVPATLKPDAITYYTLIQVYAYHGRLMECLGVFADMMTSPECITGKLDDVEKFVPGTPTLPNPILPIFRSIFLGFARHATLPDSTESDGSGTAAGVINGEPPRRVWTLRQLQYLYDDFIGLPQDAKPNSRTVYWLLVAFTIASGYDRALLRSVWERLERRYGQWWDGRVWLMRDKIYAEHFDRAYFERLRTRWGEPQRHRER